MVAQLWSLLSKVMVMFMAKKLLLKCCDDKLIRLKCKEAAPTSRGGSNWLDCLLPSAGKFEISGAHDMGRVLVRANFYTATFTHRNIL
jgi:hypothetical protein